MSLRPAKQGSNLRIKLGIASSLSLLAMTVLLNACLPLEPTLPTETPQPSDTPPPTPTIVWFPPSATPTPNPIPTYTATPEMSPGIGDVLLRDNFTDPEVWDTVDSAQASVILRNRQLSLAVEPGISVTSLRRDVTFTDFYAEITARIGLCRGEDTYGILVRASGSSFYRFTLSCNGTIQMERYLNSVRQLMVPPAASGDVPLGPPGEVTIGIWAAGGELRFFLNDRFQFTILDRLIPSGAFGVFVRSNGSTPVTITFSSLTVYDVEYVPPTVTPLP